MPGRCSFCGKPRSRVDYLVTGPRGVAICGECAALAHEVASQAFTEQGTDLLLTGISRLVTNDPRRGELPGIVEDAAVAVRLGRVTWVGAETDLPSRYRDLPTVDCEGRMVLPGFVDAGTRLLGETHRRRPDPAELVERAVGQAGRMLDNGITSIDLRAGGSADPTIDTVLLAAAREVGERLPMQVSVTWVVRSMAPGLVESVMAPAAARLAVAAELACDGDPEAGGLRRLMESTRRLRPRVRLCGGSTSACLEAATGALSVEGPGLVGPVDGTTPVVEPLSVLDGDPLPARELWDAGAPPAFASGADPDGRVVDGMGLILALAIRFGRLTPFEAVWSATRGGALALGDADRGRIRPGVPADLVVLEGEEVDDVVRKPDANAAHRVVVAGSVVPT